MMFDLNVYKLFIKSRCTSSCCISVSEPVPPPKLSEKVEVEVEVETHYLRHTN